MQWADDELVQVIADAFSHGVLQMAGDMNVATDEHDAANLVFADEIEDRFAFMGVRSPIVLLTILLVVPNHSGGEKFEGRSRLLQTSP